MTRPVWLSSIRWPILSSRFRPARQSRRPLFRPHLEILEGRWLPSTFLVINTNDSGAGSFRQAILDANATPGTNEIHFDIGGGGVQTIRPTSDLPYITHSVIIDGTTQPGFAGSPLIDFDGTSGYIGMNGLVVQASNTTIRGLAITNFSAPDDPCTFMYGIIIAGNGNVVEGNFLGTDGTRRMGNSVGVFISSGSDNRIGGTTSAQRNLISGNDVGVSIGGSNNVVEGNYIGTDVTGTAALGNNIDGVDVGGSNNLIGGTTAQASNLISGNRDAGVRITAADSNRVQGNYIGTDVTGTLALGNDYGVRITSSGFGTITGRNNLIGGTQAGAGNLISGNRFKGVDIEGNGIGNVIQGNKIGTDVTGTVALGNVFYGVSISSGSNVLVGGTAVGAGNLISGNGWDGIIISSFNGNGGNVVEGNLIGTDVTGTGALGNGHNGVHIDRDNNDTIGGEAPGAANTIAFNGGDGVIVDRGTGNAILGDFIFANSNLGIELINNGNHNQAAPVITSATSDDTRTTVSGTLTSAANSTFTLEIFANSVNNPSSSGEQFLGSVQVTTDSDGNASFTVTFDTVVNPGKFLTATATDSSNDTSPFSLGTAVTG